MLGAVMMVIGHLFSDLPPPRAPAKAKRARCQGYKSSRGTRLLTADSFESIGIGSIPNRS